MKKVIVALSICAMILSLGTAAFAYNFADHVKIAPNQKGDMLIFPFYAAANGGWESKIWVVNTALDRSVVAKVIFRSMVNTEELRDFLIYLSPTDVWTGIVRIGTTGNVEIFSDDDSVQRAWQVFATPANPMVIDIPQPTCADDTNAIGYIEVIESAHSTTNPTQALNTPPVAKTTIWNNYHSQAEGATHGEAGPTDPDMITDGINVLAGFMEFRNLTLGQNSMYNATTFRDYDATLNGGTRLTVAVRTALGELNANNSLGEIEASLNKNNVALPYSTASGTIHFLTFPTKLTNIANGCDLQRTSPSPFFTDLQAGANPRTHITAVGTNPLCVSLSIANFDLTEQTQTGGNVFSPVATGASLCAEVNYMTNFAFPEGWANYSFTAAPTMFNVQEFPANPPEGQYYGVPVIGTVLNLGADGLFAANAAYSDSQVDDIINALTYYYYQYQDETNTGYLYDSDIGIGVVNANAVDQSRVAADGDHPLN